GSLVPALLENLCTRVPRYRHPPSAKLSRDNQRTRTSVAEDRRKRDSPLHSIRVAEMSSRGFIEGKAGRRPAVSGWGKAGCPAGRDRRLVVQVNGTTASLLGVASSACGDEQPDAD